MNNIKPTGKQSEPQSSFNTHTGTLKSKLEAVGVRFSKTWDGRKWDAFLDGLPIAQHSQLSVCIKEAGKALGEI